MDLFIAWDGDHIGRQVGQLALDDDEEGLRRVSQAIDHGNQVWASWVQERMGAMISFGGDEGRARVPTEALGELERIRGLYSSAVGATVSVGVGLRLSEADKALLVAKLRGGDKILLWTPELAEDLEQLEDRSEAEKLQDEYMAKNEEEHFRPAFRNKTSDDVIETPGFHDLMHLPADSDPDEYEEGFVDAHGQFFTREQVKEHTKSRSMYLSKASPPPESPTSPATAEPASPAGGGGFTEGGSAPGAEMGSPGSAFAEGSEHSQGEAMQSMADDTSHASSSMEDELHGHAKDQDDQDKADAEAQDKQNDARSKVVEILKEVQTIAPQLEQAKEQMPELYQAFSGLVQALLITAQATLGGDDQGGPPQGGDDKSAPPEKSESSETKKSEKPDKYAKLRAYLDGPAGETKHKLKALLTKLMLKKGWPHDPPTEGEKYFESFSRVAGDAAQVGGHGPVQVHGERPTLPLIQHKFKGVGNDPLPGTPALPKTVTTITGRDVVLPENDQIGDNKHLQLVPGAETAAGYTRANQAADRNNPMGGGVSDPIPLTNTYPYGGHPREARNGTGPNGEEARVRPGGPLTPGDNGPQNLGDMNRMWGHVGDDAAMAAHPIPSLMNAQIRPVITPQGADEPYSIRDMRGQNVHFYWTPAHQGGGGGVAPPMGSLLTSSMSTYPAENGQGFNHAKWNYHGEPMGEYEKLHPELMAQVKQHLQSWLASPAGQAALNSRWEVGKGTPQPRTNPAPIPEPTQKAEAPATGKPHVVLPVGAVKDGQVKVQHTEDGQSGKTGWVSARAGQVLSNDGHPISSRNPGGK